MKKIRLLTLLVFIFSSVFSQDEDIIFSVSATKLNVLYYGIDNPIEVAVEGYKDEDVTVTTENKNSTVTKTGKGKYIFKTTNHKPFVAKVKVKGKLVEEVKFRVRELPDPVAYFGRISDYGSMSKGEILGQVVYVKHNVDLIDMRFRVLSFNLIVDNGESSKELSGSKGGDLSEEQRNLIKTLKKGDKIYFKNVIVIGADKIKRTLKGPVITIR